MDLVLLKAILVFLSTAHEVPMAFSSSARHKITTLLLMFRPAFCNSYDKLCLPKSAFPWMFKNVLTYMPR